MIFDKRNFALMISQLFLCERLLMIFTRLQVEENIQCLSNVRRLLSTIYNIYNGTTIYNENTIVCRTYEVPAAWPNG